MDLDVWDALTGAGLLLLGAGLWLAVSLGVALTVVGGLVIVLGVVGARTAARAHPAPAPTDQARPRPAARQGR